MYSITPKDVSHRIKSAPSNKRPQVFSSKQRWIWIWRSCWISSSSRLTNLALKCQIPRVCKHPKNQIHYCGLYFIWIFTVWLQDIGIDRYWWCQSWSTRRRRVSVGASDVRLYSSPVGRFWRLIQCLVFLWPLQIFRRSGIEAPRVLMASALTGFEICFIRDFIVLLWISDIKLS